MCGTIPDQPALRGAPGRSADSLVISRYVRDYAISIGCHPLLGRKEMDYIVATIKEYIQDVI